MRRLHILQSLHAGAAAQQRACAPASHAATTSADEPQPAAMAPFLPFSAVQACLPAFLCPCLPRMPMTEASLILGNSPLPSPEGL